MLELRTFGGLSIQDGSAPLTGAATQRKTLALLALLAAVGKNGLSRDKLIAYLWPETDTEHGRNLLNQACYALRRDLHAPALFLGATELRLNPDVISSDVRLFEEALARGDPEPAVAAYGGPFLDGFFLSEASEFERWVDAERAQLAQQCSDALVTLANAAAVRGDHRAAADWWRRLTAHDPLSSHAALGLMKAFVAAGESAEAIKHARMHEAFLQQDMGTAPDAAVLALVQQLCQEAERGAPPSGAAGHERVRRQSTTDFLLAAVPAALRREVRRATALSTVAAALAITLVVGGLVYGVAGGGHRATTGGPDPVPLADRKMLAVLPFENRGARTDEYFADGLSEAIATRLGSIRSLGVIAWQSTRQYKGTSKTPREIGQELGAQYLLEGTVRWEKPARGTSQVRVSPTLIRVSDGTQLWADQYDTTLAGVFAVQANLATRVAGALDLALADAERRLLEDRPTASLHAYDSYLRGRAAVDKDWDLTDLKTALPMFERAVALDSSFALAWAWSSVLHVAWYTNYVDRDPAQLTIGKAEADRAIRLAPDLPETHGALAWYAFAGLRDWDRALQEYTTARRARPSDPYFTGMIGAVNEKQGNWNAALAYQHDAVLLSPRNGNFATMLGESYTRRREFAAASYYYDRALALTPQSASARFTKAISYLNLTGDLKSAQRFFPDVSENIAPTGLEYVVTTLADFVLLLSNAQQTKLLGLSPAALDGDTAGLALAKGLVYRWREEPALARASFDSARLALQRVVQRRPDDAIYTALLGLALAGLGRTEEAVREGERAVAMLPVTKDAVDGSVLPANLARIYVLLGDRDKAIDQLELVFSRPGPLSAGWLRADPFWDSLRANPRFQRLVAARN